MELKPGDKFDDRYQLLSKLGEGGMGEVWKARDAELDRDVAVKVSKAEFTARFKQEARAMAAFSHNNICQIYDVGPNYIVMELIDGVQLSGPLPVEKAAACAGLILDALDAAHRKGFTHRDLKPANILVTKQGGLKLLDFGLAKRQVTGLGPDDVTIQGAMTKDGQITGTLQYMSPEQLNGKDADARSDIFAFGCVLYEMLSGKKAFSGSTTASVIAAIMEREPEPLKKTPPLDRAIRKCLAKDPDDRFQTARDLKYNLGLAMETTVVSAPGRTRLPWAVAAAALLIAVALGVLYFRAGTTTDPYRLEINPPPGLQFAFANNRGGSAISPDGRRVALVAGDALWVRPLDSDTSVRLQGTEGAYYPFWSPDQRSIGFFVGTKLMRVDLPSGPVIELAALETVGRNGSWNSSGTILFSENNRSIFRIPSTGGKPELLTRFDESRQEGAHYHPSFFPDGDHYLYMIRSRVAANNGIYVGSLKDSTLKRRVATVLSNAAYVPPSREYPGYLVFDRQGVLVAQPFDAKALRMTGEPEVLSSSVGLLLNNQFANFSASWTGTILFGTAGTPKLQLAWLDRSGKAAPLSSPPDYFTELRLSRMARECFWKNAAAQGVRFGPWTFDEAL